MRPRCAAAQDAFIRMHGCRGAGHGAGACVRVRSKLHVGRPVFVGNSWGSFCRCRIDAGQRTALSGLQIRRGKGCVGQAWHSARPDTGFRAGQVGEAWPPHLPWQPLVQSHLAGAWSHFRSPASSAGRVQRGSLTGDPRAEPRSFSILNAVAQTSKACSRLSVLWLSALGEVLTSRGRAITRAITRGDRRRVAVNHG